MDVTNSFETMSYVHLLADQDLVVDVASEVAYPHYQFPNFTVGYEVVGEWITTADLNQEGTQLEDADTKIYVASDPGIYAIDALATVAYSLTFPAVTSGLAKRAPHKNLVLAYYTLN